MSKDRVLIVTLGCPKNQVDTEFMLARLEDAGFETADTFEDIDAVIVNTCGFIDSAKKEAIDTILEMVDLKQDGIVKKVIVAGCLPERYQGEIADEFPEVDGFVGIGANGEIADIVRRVIDGERVVIFPPKRNLPLCGRRVLTTPKYWAYLKISEGCSNGCSYCAIPGIRGGLRCRPIEEIVEEAKVLAEGGAKEIIVIGQDVTSYGIDIYKEYKLHELLDRLCEIDGIEWIRLLYCYPDKFTDELIETMARQPKILHYVDLPLQHADNGILKAMRRNSTREEATSVISKLRAAMPDVVVRTTFITGFPGEGEKEFEHLAEFVNEIEFDRLGCFEFSAQEGTLAYKMDDDVPEDVKQRRTEVIMLDQVRINEKKNNERIGKVMKTLVEEYDSYTDSYVGRTYMDAPDIDGKITFTSEKPLLVGDFADVEILDFEDYDLVGRVKN